MLCCGVTIVSDVTRYDIITCITPFPHLLLSTHLFRYSTLLYPTLCHSAHTDRPSPAYGTSDTTTTTTTAATAASTVNVLSLQVESQRRDGKKRIQPVLLTASVTTRPLTYTVTLSGTPLLVLHKRFFVRSSTTLFPIFTSYHTPFHLPIHRDKLLVAAAATALPIMVAVVVILVAVLVVVLLVLVVVQ